MISTPPDTHNKRRETHKPKPERYCTPTATIITTIPLTSHTTSQEGGTTHFAKYMYTVAGTTR